MKKFLISALTIAMLGAVPAFGQTMPLIIEMGHADRVTATAPATLEEQVEIAAENACERPFLRDLKAQQLYADCLSEARSQAELILTARQAATAPELALR